MQKKQISSQKKNILFDGEMLPLLNINIEVEIAAVRKSVKSDWYIDIISTTP